MGLDLKRTWQLVKKNLRPWPEGERGLQVRDHRRMVGGAWEEIGSLQFEYMKSQGLRPDNVLLDIGCGSFRAGRLFIKYLDQGNYLGVDKQQELIREGRVHEVGEDLWEAKQPEVFASEDFDFSRFSKKPDYAIAQSLFTHLSTGDIRTCLKKLKEVAPAHCSLHATFFESTRKILNLLPSHSSRRFEYTEAQMREMGESAGWQMTYVGNWNHPRNQHLVVYHSKR